MPAPSAANRLRSVKRLDQLLAYLRDELDWPGGNLSVEDFIPTAKRCFPRAGRDRQILR